MILEDMKASDKSTTFTLTKLVISVSAVCSVYPTLPPLYRFLTVFGFMRKFGGFAALDDFFFRFGGF